MRITIILAILLTYSFFFLTGCGVSLAQETISTPTALEKPKDLGEALIHPASPLYFLKAIRENFEFKLAKTEKTKVIRVLEFATRRIRETKSLIKASREDLIPPTLQKYRTSLSELGNLTSDGKLRLMELETLTDHFRALVSLFDQAKSTDAKRAIRAAILETEKYFRLTPKEVSPNLQTEIEDKAYYSLVKVCDFLIYESSSSALNSTEKAFIKQRSNLCRITLDQKQSTPSATSGNL